MNRAEKGLQKNLEGKAAKKTQLIQPVQETALSPKSQQTMTIDQAIDLGVLHHNAGDLPKAETIYQQILQAEPNQPSALHLLGVIAHQAGENDIAVELIGKALAIIPDYAEAHSNLGLALQKQGKLDDALASYHKAISIKPDYAEAYNNLGSVYHDQGKLDEAIASYNTALAIDPDFDQAIYNKSLILLLFGQFDQGWPLHERRWKSDGFSGMRNFVQPLWLGKEILKGKTILLHSEQALGDTLLFCRYAKLVSNLGARVILEIPKRFVGVLQGLEGVSVFVSKDEELPSFDFHCPLHSLPLAFNTSIGTIPANMSYLVADGGQQKALRKRYHQLGNDFLVGISWNSNSPKYGKRKSMELDDFLPLLEIPNITFVDLQYGDTVNQRSLFTDKMGIEIFHDESVDQMGDLNKFASQVAALDMVVTISNTTAHMAGALGVPTLLMLDTVPIWYWLQGRGDSPWYPSMRLFRQSKGGDWGSVIENVREKLSEEVLNR